MYQCTRCGEEYADLESFWRMHVGGDTGTCKACRSLIRKGISPDRLVHQTNYNIHCISCDFSSQHREEFYRVNKRSSTGKCYDCMKRDRIRREMLEDDSDL